MKTSQVKKLFFVTYYILPHCIALILHLNGLSYYCELFCIFLKYYFHYYPLQVLYHYEVVFWLEASLWKLIGLFACWFYSKDSISNTFSGDMWNHSASCTYALYWGHINVSWHIHLHMAEIKENHKKVMVH